MKRDAMVAAIDKAARDNGLDPFNDALFILKKLSDYTIAQWYVVDRVAKLKTPSSPETQELVKNVYKERIR